MRNNRKLVAPRWIPPARAVLMLARHLTSGNADELLAAATHKSRFEIEQLLAERFPRPDLPERLRAIPAPPVSTLMAAPALGSVVQLAPERVGMTIPEQLHHARAEEPRPVPARQEVRGRIEPPVPPQRLTPLAPERFGLQVTLDQETHELLQQARELMGHQNPTGQIGPVLKSALKLLVAHLEQQKYAATEHPGPARPCKSARHIPAAVKRAVWERDEGQCTFVSDSGKRCAARSMLEFDHAEAVARGGEATASNVRLACRGHNQHAAECAFGAEFMERKRHERQARARVAQRARTTPRPAPEPRAHAGS